MPGHKRAGYLNFKSKFPNGSGKKQSKRLPFCMFGLWVCKLISCHFEVYVLNFKFVLAVHRSEYGNV